MGASLFFDFLIQFREINHAFTFTISTWRTDSNHHFDCIAYPFLMLSSGFAAVSWGRKAQFLPNFPDLSVGLNYLKQRGRYFRLSGQSLFGIRPNR